MVTNLNKDAVFTRRIDELDPAASVDPADNFLIDQAGVTRKVTLAQLRQGLPSEATLTSHIDSISNPHATTAAQVGAYTTQQTTSAINAATAAVQTNLNSHTSATNNPHGTTAAQVGAYTKAETDALVGSGGGASVAAVQAELDAHEASTDNPHATTAAQVGRDTPQWNANRIQSRGIDIGDTPTDGSTIIYKALTNRFSVEPFSFSQPAPHPVGSIVHLPFAVDGASLYQDEGSWLWYPALGRSIGSTSSVASIKGEAVRKLYLKLWPTVGVTGWRLINTSSQEVGKGVSASQDWIDNKALDIPSQAGRTLVAAGGGDGLTPRGIGTAFGSESEIIDADNLPKIPFRRNDGSAGSSPYSITAIDDKGGYISDSDDAINVDTPNLPISHMQPSTAFSQVWFTGERA